MSPALFLLAALAAQGDTGSFVIKNFRFASGEVLPELRLHYRTLGHPRRNAAGTVRNAVLVLHGTGGSGRQFLSPVFAGELYGPGQPLDTATHYLILPDNIGHGRSSKPSDGLRARFPRYAYEDMVAAQYRLVTDGLHVDHLLLVMGTSMGCMHSWLWAERYPEVMDGVVPLACIPTQIAGRNRMWRRMIIDDIQTDPEWKSGDYTSQPRGLRAALQLLFTAGSSPLQLQRTAPTRDSADAYIARWLDTRFAETDANDLLYQVPDSHERADARPRHAHGGGCLEAVLRALRCGAGADSMKVAVGERASRSLTLTPDHVNAFAQLTGDYNPLHFDPEFVARTKFGKLVVQGGLTTGLLHALVAMDLPGPGTVFLSQNWKFTAPVYIGDTITAEAEVVSVHESKPVCQLRIRVARQTGETVLEGEAWCYTFDAGA